MANVFNWGRAFGDQIGVDTTDEPFEIWRKAAVELFQKSSDLDKAATRFFNCNSQLCSFEQMQRNFGICAGAPSAAAKKPLRPEVRLVEVLYDM